MDELRLACAGAGRARRGAGQRASVTRRTQGRQFPRISSTSIRRFHDSVADDDKIDDSSTSIVTVK